MDMYHQVEQYIFSHFPHTPTAGQQQACNKLVRFLYDPDPNAAFLLKGYAGTGKTSLISALIQSAPAIKIKTQLLAPTGRAAKVLSNYSHKKAYTIHKKIYMTVTDASGSVHMARAENKHSYTLFIVDEASMIGIGDYTEGGYSQRSLLDDLIAYVMEGAHCRLLLIGDSAQLPPVGSDESPALDCDYLQSIAPLKLYETELTEVVRQEEVSGILQNATAIRNQISSLMEGEPFKHPLFDTFGCSDVIRLNGEDLEEALNKEYRGDITEDVAVVCRSNKRANMYNQAIRSRILYREEEINAGDYLMVVKNNYYWLESDSEIGFIANGDIVEVLGVRHHEEMYGFHFVDATVRFIDYPDAATLDCKLILETLHSESPSLTREESQQLFSAIADDYADIPIKADRMKAIRSNPYFNALQIKFSYALTCHKTQGGQWETVFVEQGYLTDEMMNKEYLRWLYTAITRATKRVYLLNFEERFFAAEGDAD